MTGFITAGLFWAVPARSQSDDSGFPREELHGKTLAEPTKPVVNAPPLSKAQQDKAMTYKGSRHPPRTLYKKADGHYTPYDPPAIPKEGQQPYIIVSGDTLWDLAQRNWGSPLYWPMIWEKNEYIKDAHWIYPGDPLFFMTPESRKLLTGDKGATKPEDDDRIVFGQDLPPVYERDMYCTGYVDPDFKVPEQRILVNAEESNDFNATPGFAFLNQGKNQNITVGQTFMVIRPGSPVHHPDTHADLGLYVKRIGVAKVTILADDTSVMQFTMSCTAAHRGDYLVPFEPKPAPFDITRRGDYPLYIPSNGKLQATIVMVDDATYYGAEHDIVFLNVGSQNEIAPGDKFMIYRNSRFGSLLTTRDLFHDTTATANFSDHDLIRAHAGEPLRESDLSRSGGTASDHKAGGGSKEHKSEQDKMKSRLPRQTIGEIVVIETTGSTATGRVIHNEHELQIGDMVELE
jgi:LysM repeat protein